MSCSGNYINFVVMDDQIMNQTLSDIRCRLSEKFPKGETTLLSGLSSAMSWVMNL